ncbi:MAG TPA: hypothetical protein VG347_19365, partial [Verrucomicrobiae bacterium]|nr:hypothetical protein [Verrucomicrobiae bacterium]
LLHHSDASRKNFVGKSWDIPVKVWRGYPRVSYRQPLGRGEPVPAKVPPSNSRSTQKNLPNPGPKSGVSRHPPCLPKAFHAGQPSIGLENLYSCGECNWQIYAIYFHFSGVGTPSPQKNKNTFTNP